MYSHQTSSGSTGSNVFQGHARKAIIQNNGTITGIITVSDETGTAGTPVIATITNPTMGTQYEYWDLKNGLTVQSNVAFDVTVNVSSGMGGNQ